MKLQPGLHVKFASEKQRYTVQASDRRFAVCTKPFNARKTVLYTIIDFDEKIRGPENLVFGAGAETKKQCEEMLDRLKGIDRDRSRIEEVYRKAGMDPGEIPANQSEVSHRHRCALDMEPFPQGDHGDLKAYVIAGNWKDGPGLALIYCIHDCIFPGNHGELTLSVPLDMSNDEGNVFLFQKWRPTPDRAYNPVPRQPIVDADGHCTTMDRSEVVPCPQ